MDLLFNNPIEESQLLKATSVACAVGPGVITIEGSSDFSFQTQFLQFVWISSNKIYSKINIFHTLGLK